MEEAEKIGEIEKETSELKKLIKCYHCTYEWEYSGNSEYYITCPRCLSKISLKKILKENENTNQEEHKNNPAK